MNARVGRAVQLQKTPVAPAMGVQVVGSQ